jgi:hypothetical protein
MAEHKTTAPRTHRRQVKRQGVVRVELRLREEDAALLRGVVHALTDPAREARTRAVLNECVAAPAQIGLKALLAAAPLEDVTLERPRDMGRAVAL